MKPLKTKLQKLNDIIAKEDDVELLKFYFNTDTDYKNCKITKAKYGVNVKTKSGKLYAEVNSNKYIHLFTKNGTFLEQIQLKEFKASLKRVEDLFNL